MAESAPYQVVARRYRPQRFDELVGQEHVARGLSGAIESGRIGHAYLFTGARGVGKTSAARIYAKALECSQGPAAEPCNACDSCLAIAAGQDVDVVEIDAASNRGIDEIRQLRQNVAVRPARGRYKVYIIDEVHMLTREAFNALLKTLEEPPSHVKFVLCTTEPEKLPITILSRCQRFDFVTVDAPAIARRLQQIVEAEGGQASPEALSLIARRAAGSMRDSQSLLEQLLGSATGAIDVDAVHAVIGTGREEHIGRLVQAIAARDPRAALEAFDGTLSGGADPGGILEQLIAALRDALLASVGCEPGSRGGPAIGDAIGIDLAAVGRATGTETVLAMLQIVDQALSRMRTSGHAAVLAEMAIVRLAKLDDLDDLADVARRIVAEPGTPGTAGPAAAARPQPAQRVERVEREKKTTDLTPAAAAVADAVPPGPAAAPPAEVAEPPPLPADAHAAWLDACEKVGGLAADFAATATSARWKDDHLLEVTMPADATTAVAFLRRPEVAAAIMAKLRDALSRDVRHALAVEASPPASAGEATAVERPRPVASQAALLRDVMDHPLVTHARTLFDAAVRKVEPARASEATARGQGSPADPVARPADGAAVESSGEDDDG